MKFKIPEEIVKVFDFSLVGATTFSIQIFLTLLLTEVLHVPYYISYAMALTTAWFTNFILNMKFTFKATKDIKHELERFGVVAVVAAIINWTSVFIIVQTLHVHYILAILVISVFLAIFSFKLEEAWVFAKKNIIE